MDIQRIRQLRLADPFRPFKLVMDDGRVLPVERLAFLGISPKGRDLIYAAVAGGFEFLKVDRVRDVAVDENLRPGVGRDQ